MITRVERRLETGLLATVAGGVVAVVAGTTEWLKSIVNPDPTPGILMVAVAVGVLLLTAVAVALVLALAARLIEVASGLQEGFWPDTGLFLQDFALWLTMWAVFWGIPFAVAMFLAGILTKYLLTVPAVIFGTAIGLLLLFLFKRYFSPQTWTVLDRFWPARRVGSFWMIVGVLLLTLPGRLLLGRCYTFEVEGASGVHRRGETRIRNTAVLATSTNISGRSSTRTDLDTCPKTSPRPWQNLLTYGNSSVRKRRLDTMASWLLLPRHRWSCCDYGALFRDRIAARGFI
jgi:hypothetical protein